MKSRDGHRARSRVDVHGSQIEESLPWPLRPADRLGACVRYECCPTRDLVVELSHPNSWYKILNKDDKVLGIESFGESAPANVLLEHFGFTTENVVELSKSLVND